MKIKSFFRSQRAARFEQQIRPHLSTLYQYACRLTMHTDNAEDVVQDLLMHLYEREIDLSKMENSRTWLLKSLYHQFIDFTRRQKRNASSPNPQEDQLYLEQQVDPQAGPGEQLAQDQTAVQLEQAIDRLEPEQKMLLLWHDVEGYTLNEIADMLDTPLGTLKSRLHRTRKALRQVLQQEPFRDIRRVNSQRPE